jgi:hypothetical protein
VLGLLVLAVPAGAQEGGRINSVVRQATVKPPGGAAVPARKGTPVPPGSEIRTAGRSKVGVKYEDGSRLLLDQKSTVGVRGTGQRDVRVLGGRVLGDFKKPGTVSGGYATAAVRGTKMIFFEDDRSGTAYVRNYEGRTFVSGAGLNMRAGIAEAGTEDTLTDAELVDDPTDWRGSTCRITDGAGSGQERTVVDFDPASGTLTVAPGFDRPIDHGSEYVLISDANAPVAVLNTNEGVTVHNGRPSRVYSVAPLAFAEGERNPWFRELIPGVSVLTYPGTDSHLAEEDDSWPVREAIDVVTGQEDFGDLNTLATGDLVVVVPPGALAARAASAPGGRLRSLLTQDPGPGMLALDDPLVPVPDSDFPKAVVAGDDKGAAGPDWWTQSKEERPGPGGSGARPANPGTNIWFRVQPFVVGSNRTDSEGIRVRAQSVYQELYMEVGGLLWHHDDVAQARLSEGFYQWRTRPADLLVGRQHVFLGPFNNLEVPELLGFETADAAILQPAVPGPFRAQVGYLANTSPLFGTGFDGVFARGEAFYLNGVLGGALFKALVDHTQVGWSVDGSYPLLPGIVDGYALGGQDPFDHRLLGGGLYLPWLYQQSGVDAFVEYGDRETFRDHLQLRLRRNYQLNWLFVAFVDKAFGGRLNGGGGVQYTATIR